MSGKQTPQIGASLAAPRGVSDACGAASSAPPSFFGRGRYPLSAFGEPETGLVIKIPKRASRTPISVRRNAQERILCRKVGKRVSFRQKRTPNDEFSDRRLWCSRQIIFRANDRLVGALLRGDS